MREDMFKIIVERPRWGSRSKARFRGRLAGEDDLPTKIGMKRHILLARLGWKNLNENLKPLERYLGRQIGRKWDDVYSEICATLDPGHTVKQHVRDHLVDLVARVVICRDGAWLCAPNRHGQSTPEPWPQTYYVDPVSGRLERSADRWKERRIDPKPWRRRDPLPDPDIRVLGSMRELRRIEGIWYEVHFHREKETAAWTYDLIRKMQVPAETKHAIAKRQLSRDELLAFGLMNSNT